MWLTKTYIYVSIQCKLSISLTSHRIGLLGGNLNGMFVLLGQAEDIYMEHSIRLQTLHYHWCSIDLQ